MNKQENTKVVIRILFCILGIILVIIPMVVMVYERRFCHPVCPYIDWDYTRLGIGVFISGIIFTLWGVFLLINKSKN